MNRPLRALGITAIFALACPLMMAVVMLLVARALGTSIFELLSTVIEPGALQSIAQFAMVLLAFFAVVAAIPPSLLAGLIFAICAVYAGLNTLWMAWLSAAAAIAIFLLLGASYVPPESSALMLPSVQSPEQAASTFGLLGALAIVPVSLCWWFARPLHRDRITP